jgi:hypothetical protein
MLEGPVKAFQEAGFERALQGASIAWTPFPALSYLLSASALATLAYEFRELTFAIEEIDRIFKIIISYHLWSGGKIESAFAWCNYVTNVILDRVLLGELTLKFSIYDTSKTIH